MPSSTALAKLVVLGIVAIRAAAGVIEARTPLKHLFARQSACTTACSPFQNALDVCGNNTSCLCTRAVAVALNNCVNCHYEQSPTPATLSTLNELIDNYENDICPAYGDLPHASVTTSGSAVGGSVTAPPLASSSTAVGAPSITSRSTVTSIAGDPTTIAPPQTVIHPPSTTADTGSPANTAGGSNGGNGAMSSMREGRWSVMVAASAVLALLAL